MSINLAILNVLPIILCILGIILLGKAKEKLRLATGPYGQIDDLILGMEGFFYNIGSIILFLLMIIATLLLCRCNAGWHPWQAICAITIHLRNIIDIFVGWGELEFPE